MCEDTSKSSNCGKGWCDGSTRDGENRGCYDKNIFQTYTCFDDRESFDKSGLNKWGFVTCAFSRKS